jgi:regulatory protein
MSGSDPAERALALAFRYLGRRERTVQEMRRHLDKKGVEADTLERTLAELREHGYLDDQRFARMFVADKRELEGWGGERIGRVLRERGVERELVAEALAERDGEGELERALAVLARRCPEPPQDHREHERALAILVRKGYEIDVALDALRAHGRSPQRASSR